MSTSVLHSRSTTAAEIDRSKLFRAGVINSLVAVAANVVTFLVLAAVLPLPANFPPLAVPAIAIVTLIGTVAAAVVFAIIARVARHPLRVWTIVALAALVVSILPNFGLMANPSGMPFPGGTPLAFGVLIVFHIVAGLISLFLLPALSRKA